MLFGTMTVPVIEENNRIIFIEKNMNMKKKLFNGLILIGVLVLVASCKGQQSKMASSNYKTMKVSRTDRTLYYDFSATIQGKQDVSVYPQISGLITEVCVKEGAPVKKGQTLFVIDPTPYKAALAKAKANVEVETANVATAQMTADSKESLYKEKVVSLFDLQTARNSLRSAKASLAQAQAELVTARNNLSYTEINSPVNGTAGMSSYRIGALVSSSQSSPMISVSDNAEMYVYFSMTERQMLALSRKTGSLTNALNNMPAVTLLLSDGTEYSEKGKIDAISGMIDTSTGAVTLRAVFPNPNHILRSGSTGNIRFPYEKQGCIVIPQTATYELQDKVFVYKVVNGKTQSSQVKVLDRNNGKEYIVESGLETGDVIIAEGAGLLTDGISVNKNTQVAGNAAAR